MSKLTLSVDEEIIIKAKSLAEQKGTSVSKLFSGFIAAQANRDANPHKPGRLARQATGLIRSPNINQKEILESALMEKHGL